MPLTRPWVQQFTVAAGVGPGTFFPGSDPGVGSGPQSVAVGDVDNDGDLDLLVANANDGTVSVRLNNGAGIFGGGSDPAVGSSPSSVALGDVDGDLDLLTANATANTVSVRLNNGAGVFGGGSNPAVGSGPVGVAVGDVDGDGDLDLLTANINNSTVSVRLNNGSGTFGGGSDTAVGSGPVGVVVGDVDKDGDLDLLTANSGDGTVSVRLNNGSGAFGGGSTLNVAGLPQSVAVGDVNGDGDLDLLTANNGAASMSVRLNQLPATLALTSLSPSSGVAGTVVTLTGTGFTGATGVSFNGTAAATFAVTNATTATATVPAGATTGNVTITTPAGTSNGAVFTRCVPQALARNATVQLGATGNASITAATVNNGSTANCGFAVGGGLSVSPSAFTCANRGANTVTLTATDAFGNVARATATVTVADGLAPSITAPAAVTRPTDTNQCTAAAGRWLGTATATDNCGAVVTSNAPAFFATGLTTVTWTATDPAGNTATATQQVTVEDRQNPTFATQPGLRNVNTDAGLCATALVLVPPTASDNCAGATVAGVRRDNLLLTAPFAKGTTVITWTASDGAGNTVSYDQSIVVTDNEAPVARTQAASVTLSPLGTATLLATAVDNGSSDNCGIVSRVVSPSAFTCATLGARTVTLTVTDAFGNTNSATVRVTVVGSIPVAAITVVPQNTVNTGGVPTNLYLGYGPQSVTLRASAGGTSYAWTRPAGLSSTSAAAPVFTATQAGSFTYMVTITNQYGCSNSASVTLTVRNVRCGNKNDKVLVCHSGNALCIVGTDVASHLSHGDPLGACLPASLRLLAAPDAAAAPRPAAAPQLEAYPNPTRDACVYTC